MAPFVRAFWILAMLDGEGGQQHQLVHPTLAGRGPVLQPPLRPNEFGTPTVWVLQRGDAKPKLVASGDALGRRKVAGGTGAATRACTTRKRLKPCEGVG